MVTKIHINLSQGILEVEGEPDFVRNIYDNFKTDLSDFSLKKNIGLKNFLQLVPPKDVDVINIESEKTQNIKTNKTKNKLKATNKKESYSFLKLLNTGLQGDSNSIFAYLDEYKPSNGIEYNVVFMKYLHDQYPNQAVTYDHIYTCYHNTNTNLPKNLNESIKTAANASKGHGYIDRSNSEDLKLIYKAEVLLQKLKSKAS